MKDKIEKWYNMGLWSADMVQNAVSKGILTEAEAATILGENEEEN